LDALQRLALVVMLQSLLVIWEKADGIKASRSCASKGELQGLICFAAVIVFAVEFLLPPRPCPKGSASLELWSDAAPASDIMDHG
jgi:hypothetical protein